jgi:hypothetical protein
VLSDVWLMVKWFVNFVQGDVEVVARYVMQVDQAHAAQVENSSVYDLHAGATARRQKTFTHQFSTYIYFAIVHTQHILYQTSTHAPVG